MMGKFADNPNYVRYETLLRKLHLLDVKGRGDAEEADQLRDEMDAPYRGLTSEEVARIRGLSADLYMLQDDEVYEPTDPAERTPERLGTALRDAWQRGDAEATLALLRKGPSFMPKDRIAYLRARAYEQLRHLDAAHLFMAYAAHLEPRDDTYKRLVLDLLLDLGRLDEAVERANEYLVDAGSAPGVVIRSASVLLESARGLPKAQATPLRERIIEWLRPTLAKEQSALTLSPADLAFGYFILGLCYQGLDQFQEARSAYDAALEADPDHNPARVARGLLLTNQDPDGALRDFEKAVLNNAPMVLPYLYVAHQAIVEGNYKRCVALCNKALTIRSTPSLVAVVWQWKAIAQSELNLPNEVVRQSFERAVTLDPLNAQIQHNFEVFKESAASAPGSPQQRKAWQTIEVPGLEAARRNALDPLAHAA
jgi:tetratricopeptide (TPR) repeat protein